MLLKEEEEACLIRGCHSLRHSPLVSAAVCCLLDTCNYRSASPIIGRLSVYLSFRTGDSPDPDAALPVATRENNVVV